MRLTCDTSVLIPALTGWHPEHDRAREALRDVAAVPLHVLVECYSVLTRLPPPHRVAADVASASIAGLPWSILELPGERVRDLLATLATNQISGGASYDGLIAATALHHEHALLSGDQRARRTYDVIGASVVSF